MDTFDRYAFFIQDYIYQNDWQSLRAVQTAAADVIFNTDENLLLTASTASGKTEAAFFPILTLFTEDMPSSVGAIYIAPLKALINDQFSRLNEICNQAEIPIWHWHGEVSQYNKHKLLKRPSGILQITPESLEALLLRRHSVIPKLFNDLRFIVIDEIHSLLRGDRGGQTLCLIERLSRLAGVNPRRIGLSATIGDPKAAGIFLSAGTKRRTVIPRLPPAETKWRLCMEHFYTACIKENHTADKNRGLGLKNQAISLPLSKSPARLESKTDTAPVGADPGIGYIFEHTRGKKCLVFVNSREECEAVTTTLRQYCEANNEPDRFLIHHGNLSESYRETAEASMKDDDQLQTTVTTATLELGIDIGRLERAFQIDAPFTVSSFLQRMGRTGRRDLPQEMCFVVREEPLEPRSPLPATIPWKLLQGIALIQLYLEERWVEPPRLDRLPYSLLYHQTMSTMASCGEMLPAELAARVLSLQYFHKITTDDFRILLRHLLKIDHLQLTERGGLIVGIKGEKIINNYKFYAVFKENEEYTVRSGSEELGTIVSPPPVGEKIAIAGHVWIVEDVDYKRHLIYCEKVKGKVPAYFGEVAGDIHTRILERMRKALDENKPYPYLMENAVSRLKEARISALNSGLPHRSLVCLGGNMYCLFPWLGTYAFLALERFLKLKCSKRLGLKGLDAARPYFMQFVMTASETEFFEIIREELNQEIDPMTLLYPKEVPVFDKYDEYLPESLVQKGFALGVLDVDEMKEKMLELCDKRHLITK